MTHYLINFVGATLAVIAFLYLIYFFIKQNPQFSVGLPTAMKPSQGNKKTLQIESILNLEPRKRLYVIGHGSQRFLIATTMDKTEMLATLEPEENSPNTAITLDSESFNTHVGIQPPFGPESTFMERFAYSLKTVLVERFSGLGKSLGGGQ